MKKKLITIIPLVIFILLIAIFIKDLITICPTIFNGESEIAEGLLKGFGWKGVFYLILIQACQMLLVFLPSEFIQVVSGATYGIFYGTLVCWGGLILGATIIYLLVNVFKQNINAFNGNENSEEIISALTKTSNSAFKVTLILFFLPAIPYGVICYFASGTNMNYPKYILSCLIGVLPSIILDSLLGKIAINAIAKFMWPVIIGFVLVMILFIWIVKVFTNRKVNKILYGKSKPEIDVVLSKRKVNRPSGKSYNILKNLLCKWYVKRNNVHCNGKIKTDNQPFILLASHLSKEDFVYALKVIENDSNIVCNRYYFNNPLAFKLFNKYEIISKKMFTADVSCIKNIIKIIKSGGSCILFIEGRLSINGISLEIPCGLGKLLKKLDVPVYGLIPHGAYLTDAKWMKKRHKGLVELETKTIFLKEELENLTPEEVEKGCVDALNYDEFEWLKNTNVTFKSSNMLKGIDGILYHCPHCHSEFTLIGVKNKIICNNCNNETIMNDRFEFINPPTDDIKNIRDWYNYQVQIEKQKVTEPNFSLECDVTAKTYNKYGKGLDVISDGKCILNSDGLKFVSYKDSQLNNEISYNSLKTLLFGCNEDFETYIDDKFYFFVPKGDKRICVKWAICSEEMSKYVASKNKDIQ